MNDDDFKQEVRDGLRSLRDDIKELARQTAETNTTLIMRGGVIDRLDAAEESLKRVSEKATETKAELGTIKAKVAFAAACVSALIASAWAIITQFWKVD